MPTLASGLRNQLERVVVDARDVAEAGARVALEALAVHHYEPYPHMKARERELRNHLRARARQLGDRQDTTGRLNLVHLVGECAYEHWHRMLFARFLAENNLLIEPQENMPISLAEAEELAKEEGVDVWVFASRCAQRMLPQIFRPEDPLLQVSFATEHRIKLEGLLDSLPQAVFTASDALGWVYQFWQSKKKDEVNRSEVKIGADELPVVTQLFTEPYMVNFLIHNTLGAWHAGKKLTAKDTESAKTEEELRRKVALPGVEWEYLRFVKVARPSRSGSSSGLHEDTLSTGRGENLPHWTCDNATYHVSFRLADSVPQATRDEWVREREAIIENAKRAKRELTAVEEERMRFLYSDRIENFLDAGHGACYLAKPETAELVAGALRHFDGDRYKLHAWCVMPNHVHAVVEPLAGHDLSAIIHSWKSYTAHEANQALGRSGDFWQHDAYNHIIRSEKEYVFQTRYVWENPDKAGLKDWRWRGVTRSSRSGASSSAATEPDRDGLATIWRPAAGAFDGWAKVAKDIKVLDPCCGSGHFLVAALHHLVPIRMAEEGLSAPKAVDAVLRDNLHGLEIDERCCQIAAFALAFAAWTYPNADGYRPLPELHIACTGIGPQATEEQWLKLVDESGIPIPRLGREPIRDGLRNLHRLFSQAPTLGSLINPAELPSDLFVADYETIQPYLTAIMSAERADDETRERAIAAAGMAKAADLLAGEYTLVVTNVPYLSRTKFATALSDHVAEHFSLGKSDLATVFVLRCHGFLASAGTAAMVTPENWLFLDYHRQLRKVWLRDKTWQVAARLGPGAFAEISGEVVKACLLVLGESKPRGDQYLSLLDVSDAPSPSEKDNGLITAAVRTQPQSVMLSTPNNRVVFGDVGDGPLLEQFATFHKGVCTGDDARFKGVFWELGRVGNGWVFKESSFTETKPYIGKEHVFFWQDGHGEYYRFVCDRLGESGVNAWIRGQDAWGRRGVVIQCIGQLPATMYVGCPFDSNVTVIIPRDEDHLAATWAFCSSPDFSRSVLAIDHSLKVPSGTLLRVPFDLARWQKVTAQKCPDGLPEPESDDPTQWLFHGRPDEAQEGTELQVGVARLLGYRWPAELDDKMRLSKRARALVAKCGELAKFADNDGIVCIPSVRGEEPAAERLLRLLAACDIEPGVDLDDWLRNDFFQEHCNLFHHRPFIWHIWDGRKRDGFHALVNYHKLCERGGKGRKLLESLTYSYLGEWIARQKDEVRRGEGGAEDRLAAAVELQKRLVAILEGEPPFDLFVRWKPLAEQPIGWEPDINDGVRMNIRPFLVSDLPNGRKGAGILRYKPNIKWKKDRGKEPTRPKEEYPWFWGWDEKAEDFPGGKEFDGNRWNDCHYINKAKQAAREAGEANEGKK